MKRNKIVILHKKGPPVYNNPIWYLKGQYAMILLPIVRKISESEAAARRYTEKLFFQVAEGKKKRYVRSSVPEG